MRLVWVGESHVQVTRHLKLAVPLMYECVLVGGYLLCISVIIESSLSLMLVVLHKCRLASLLLSSLQATAT